MPPLPDCQHHHLHRVFLTASCPCATCSRVTHTEAAAAGESAPKKSKQQGGKSSSGPRPLAVVGDAQLAATRPAIVRELYSEHPELTAMDEDKVAELMEQRRTVVDGSSLRPVMSFEQTGLPADMLHATRDFVQPSPIQSQVRQQLKIVEQAMPCYWQSPQDVSLCTL